MNILILDVDGVLNNTIYIQHYCKKDDKKGYSCENYPFDPNCLEKLQTIVNETDSKLVISSKLRYSEEGYIKKLMEELKKYDLDKSVIDFIPVLNKSKGEEIDAYLESLETPPDNFIILDDEAEGLEKYSSRLVKTISYVGLTDDNVLDAIARLNPTKNNDIEFQKTLRM